LAHGPDDPKTVFISFMRSNGRWAGFRVEHEDGTTQLFELNNRGLLVVSPPRQRRRIASFTDDCSPANYPHNRVARLLFPPDLLLSEGLRDAIPPPEAAAEREAESANRNLLSDNSTFHAGEIYVTFDSFSFGF
jgi:hypothetical protein